MTTPRDKIIKILPILGLLAVAAIILRGPLFFGKSILVVDVTRYAPWGDGKGVYKDNPACAYQPFYIYPAKTLYKQYVSKGQLPGWEPKLMAGYPIEGDPMYGWFDPFNLIFLVFSVETGLKLLALIQLFLIGLFSYGYLRQVGLKQISSFFGGMASLTSAFVITHIPNPPAIQSVMWFPFLLWMFERMYSKCKAWPYIGLMSIGVALSLLGGELTLSISILTGFFLYACGRIFFPGAWECLESKPKLFGNVLIAFLLGLLLAAPQVLSTWELSRLSYYNPSVELLGVPWPHRTLDFLITLINPYFLGRPTAEIHMFIDFAENVGYSGWVFMLLAFWGIRFKYRDYRMMVLIALASLAIGGFYFQQAPDKVGCLFLFGISLALIAGFGLEELLGSDTLVRRRFGMRMIIVLICLLVTIMGAAISFPDFCRIYASAERAIFFQLLFADFALISCLAIGAAIFIYLISKGDRTKWIAAGCLVVVALADFTTLSSRFLIFQDSGYPKADSKMVKFLRDRADEGRIMQMGEEYGLIFPPLTPLLYGIEDPFGNGSQIKFLPKHSLNWQAPAIDRCSPWLDALRVRYYLITYPLPNEACFPEWKLNSFDGILIYENNRAYSHGWVVPTARFYNDEYAAIMAIRGVDPSREVIVEGQELGFIKGGKGTVSERRPSNDEMKFDVDAPEGGWLVVSETYYPGWEAEVNGEPTRIYKADVAFMAVPLKPGPHYVIFTYHSTMRKIGYHFAGLAAYILIMGFLWGATRKSKSHA